MDIQGQVVDAALEDLERALKSVLPDLLPSMKFQVRRLSQPHPGLAIEIIDDSSAAYPYFHIIREQDIKDLRKREG